MGWVGDVVEEVIAEGPNLRENVLHVSCRNVLDIQDFVDVGEAVFRVPAVDGVEPKDDFKDGIFREDVFYGTDLTFACDMPVGKERVDGEMDAVSNSEWWVVGIEGTVDSAIR